MRFTKGLILGTMITASAMMLYSENVDDSKRKMIKKGKKIMKKMGI